eukprot:TRINITY_DN1893_c0_g4_i1.p1 TRINITY_DN1893_c0_g4~~TRINITY_DN1893_c0_g4_i1.p1  ORF type:complete len:2321 (+),score=415.01 TRINITY_DN1893_c0_g4_i1:69-7031(+)
MLALLLLTAAAQPLETVEAFPAQRTFMLLMTCNGGCNGHGVCEVSTGMCECDDDSTLGHWDRNTGCSTCLEGYAGLSCTTECPGGSCNQCSGNGKCSEGQMGNGTCTCNSMWTGAACDECNPGYYGTDCLSPCPGLPTICEGRGVCDSGVAGTGTCTCRQDPANGYWGSASGCADCDSTHYGPQCTLQCVSQGICSSHGTCNSGKAGDGACICSVGWTSVQCSVRCAGSNATHECGGTGTCLPDGSCTCLNADFKLPGCTECVDGKTGPLCADKCPVNSIGLSCGGNGVCNRDGTCTCFIGYAHSQTPGDEAACQMLCPGKGSPNPPCSGNGKCDQNTATCTCHSSATEGYWNGPLCDTCKTGWSGRPTGTSRGCHLPCPGATECNGHGTCLEGQCFCDTTWCGDACQTSAVGGSCNSCAPGTWSPVGDPNLCSQTCKGVGTPAGKCSGHGECIETNKVPLGNPNDCVCELGFGSADCSMQCPGGTAPCGGPGRGACNPDTLECICYDGYAGGDCSVACPVDAKGRPCGGNRCFDYGYVVANGAPKPPNVLGGCDCQVACLLPTSTGCALGYVGMACNVPCDCTLSVNGTQEAHGHCDISGVCICEAGWTGDHCEKCLPGKYSSDCSLTCGLTTSSGFVTGETAGTACQCKENWFGEDCTQSCNGVDATTGLPGSSGICSNNGVCNWGSGNSGDCACNMDYYGDDCLVKCDAAKCQHLNHWMCDANGDCACIDDATGHWANISTGCVECKEMWWGALCDMPCDCSTHGTCDRSSGVPCTCFSDPIKGYWSGKNCEACKTGYVGLQCNGKHIPITRIGTIDPRLEMQPPSALYVDEEEGYIYAGGEKLAVISMRVKQGNNQSFPVLNTTSDGHFGCTSGQTGTVTFVTKNLITIYMMVPECNGVRVYEMPSVQQGGISFSRASLLLVDSSLTDATQIATTKARDQTILGSLLQVSGKLSLRVIDLTTKAVTCQSLDLAKYLTNATSIAADYSGSKIYVSGTGVDGNWAVLEVDKMCTSQRVLNTAVFQPGAPCDQVECILMSRITYYKDALLGTIEGERGTGVTVLNLNAKMNTVMLSLTRIHGSAIAVDEYTDVAYVTVNVLGEPSTATKYSFIDVAGKGLSPIMYGELDLTFTITSSGFVAERITALFPASSWRIIYGLTDGNLLRLIPFLLYEVHEIYPPVSDTKGGTLMEIRGNGFAPLDLIGPEASGVYTSACSFANADFQTAIVVNKTLMRCRTDAVTSTSTSCVGDPLEVTAYGSTNTLTNNEMRVVRLHSASINETRPNKGFHTGQDEASNDIIVTVKGYGFQQTAGCDHCLACKFYDNTTEYISKGSAMVTFINPYSVQCKQPGTADGVTGPSKNPSFLDITLDGQIYSSQQVPYVIVGDPANLKVSTDATVLKAALSTGISEMVVQVIDSEGHTVEEYDKEKRVVTVEVVQYTAEEDGRTIDTVNSATKVNLQGGSCTTDAGSCIMQGLAIENPITGTLVLRLSTSNTVPSSSAVWEATVTFSVTEGDPVRLIVQDQPSKYIPSGFANLPSQPVITQADEIGNPVRNSASVLTSVAQLTSDPKNYSHGQIFPSKQTGSNDQNGVMSFEGIAIRAVYGTVYKLNFSIPERPDLGWVLSDEMQKVGCDITEYSVDWTEHCAECPKPGGLCNGSSEVLTEPGYWRANENTTTFYKCKNSASCIGGAAGGDDLCKDGMTGPVCEVCVEGYGKSPSGCVKCSSNSRNITAVAIVFFIVLCVLIVWIIMTLGKTVDSAHTIVGRIFVSHLQAGSVGDFSDNWSQFTKDVFDMQSQGSTLSVDGFSALDCLMRDMGGDYYTYFTGYMMLPVFPLLIAGIVFAVIVIRRTVNPSLMYDKKAEEEIQQLSRQHEVNADDEALLLEDERVLNNIYTYKFSQVLLTTMSVCLFVLYPTLINQAAVMLRCNTYFETIHEIQPDGEWGHTRIGKSSFLAIDQSIDCSTGKYGTYKLFATLGLIGYGLGIPIVFVAFVKSVWKKKGYKQTYVMFIFLMGGFTKRSWFWQAVIMLRKLALGIIAVFINGKDDSDPSNDALQSYVAIWVITACLVLQLYVKPYQLDGLAPYNNLEALSLGVISFTLNLGLLYNWKDMPSALRNCLTAVLAIVTFATLGLFLYYILTSIIPVISEALDKDGDGKFTKFDLKLWLRMESISDEAVLANKIKAKKAKAMKNSDAAPTVLSSDPPEEELYELSEKPSFVELDAMTRSDTSGTFTTAVTAPRNSHPLNRYKPPDLTSPVSAGFEQPLKPTRTRKNTIITDGNIETTLLQEQNIWDDNSSIGASAANRSPKGRGSFRYKSSFS